jgi:hypothetical protein
VEVALAISVLALVIITTITALQRCFAQLDTARNLETASWIMQCEIEKERLMPWDQVNDASYAPVIDTDFYSIPNAAGRFALSRAMTTVPNRSGEVIQITLTVTWRNYDGRMLSRNLTTYYTKNGLYAYFHDRT